MTRRPAKGILACLAAALVGVLVNQWVPILSALLVAIVAGVMVGNLRPVPASWRPGIAVSAKTLLRAGIVLLGLKMSLGGIVSLGWPVVLLVVTIVGLGIPLSYLIGRAFGVDRDASILVACGFSICGAAAVAAVDGVIKPSKESVAAAIGLVVLFGTAMIPLVPALASLFGLSEHQAAIWAGGGTHEVAQVVAIGGIMGGGAVLSTAVVVKLARVAMLAPAMVGIAIWQRRRAGASGGTRPPLVQGFVVGFLIMVLVRTLVPLPEWLLSGAELAQTVLLAMAMFALGLGVNRHALAAAGGRVLALGAAVTVLVNVIALGGALLVG